MSQTNIPGWESRPALAAAAQTPNPGAYVELFTLDLTNYAGGSVYHFTPSAGPADPISFGGIVYTPVEMETEGFEWTSSGSLPTPRIRIANINRQMSSLIYEFSDLLGGRVTRLRTFDWCLDGQPGADPLAYMPPDIYRVERKSLLDKTHVEFELSASIDQEGAMLPGRQVLRDNCTRIYRTWNGGGWTITDCPYSGSACFTATGQPTGDASKDVCGRRLSDCKLRFGSKASLPFGGFPGVSRARVSTGSSI
ncbi:phage minor tail protein L [Azospirillum sp. Sh1]|uniref:phage minor tail protein L n=1 Tax=Azospirillum sp. Sh1 TaxID=2607285 RepID=UPI0011EF4331|nr:phage minor tail protein L [Azospirillum sp. Sh1]KAA0573368.1 phage minor tail protein L [Azospirillum sp. Sh1]